MTRRAAAAIGGGAGIATVVDVGVRSAVEVRAGGLLECCFSALCFADARPREDEEAEVEAAGGGERTYEPPIGVGVGLARGFA